MVDLSGPDSPYQHGFNNVVFVVPTIIVVGLSEEELGISIVGGCSIEMWTSLVVCVLKMFVSTYADDKVVSESVVDPEKARTMDFDGSSLNVEALREMIDSQVDISEEERADLKESLIKLVQGRASDVLQAPTRDLVDQTFVLLSLLFVVALIFVFFIYKLFKCLREREQKREEKKKNKQLKKKK